MSKVFSVTKIMAKRSEVINIVPDDSPYFEPHRIQFRSFDRVGQTFEDLDFKVGAATVGGSPQLSINALTPDDTSLGISSKDLDRINWATFSTVGLARELQISVYNPHDTDLLIYTCIEGRAIPSLNCYASSPGEEAAKDAESLIVGCSLCRASAGNPCTGSRPRGRTSRKQLKHPHRVRKEAAALVQKAAGSDSNELHADMYETQISSETIEIAPRGQKKVQVISNVSPYFKPFRSRVHAIINQTTVPIVIVDILCGRQSMFGGIFQMFEMRDHGQPWLEDGPYDAIDRLRKYIGLMEENGISGVTKYKREQIAQAPIPEVNGIPNTLLEDSNGWHNVSSMPIFSTHGLGKPCFYLLYNPWPFNVRASVTVSGSPMFEG